MNKELFLKVINHKPITILIFNFIKSHISIDKRYPVEISNRKYKWDVLIEIPYLLVRYGYLKELIQYYQRYPIPRDMLEHFRYKLTKLLDIAIEEGHFNILKYLIEDLVIKEDIYFYSFILIDQAVKCKRWDIFDYLVTVLPLDNKVYGRLLSYAPLSFSFDRLKSISESANFKVESVSFQNCRFASALENSAFVGRIDMIEWLLENRSPEEWNQFHCIYDYAIKGGHLNVIHFLQKNGVRYSKKRPTDIKYPIDLAVKYNRLEILKYLHTAEEFTGLAAEHLLNYAGNSDIDMIEWIHKNRTETNTEALSLVAAKNGRLDIIRWLHINRSDTIDIATMDTAALYGHQDIIVWLHENRTEGCSTTAMDRAATIDILKWLHTHEPVEGCTTMAMNFAAERGDLERLIWLHENRTEGCTANAMDNAASSGQLQVIQWIHENRSEGCTFKAMDNAAINGHIEVVQWLHDHRSEGCSVEMVEHLIRRQQYVMFKWLLNNRPEFKNVHIEPTVILNYIGEQTINKINLEMYRWLTLNYCRLDQLIKYRETIQSDIKKKKTIYPKLWSLLNQAISEKSNSTKRNNCIIN